jgi:hypothetical protein
LCGCGRDRASDEHAREPWDSQNLQPHAVRTMQRSFQPLPAGHKWILPSAS